VSVIPSHLHFDHVNGLKYFQSISLIDLPETRGHGRGDVVQLGRYQYMGASPPSFKVTEWVKPGATLDLGGRKVEIWSTPGHTTNSVSVWEPERKRLYTGDLIYPTSLYAFMLDSSLSTYISTLDRLQTTLPADAKLYGAHCCRNDAPPHAPWLDMTDVHDARMAVSNVMSGQAKGRGLVLRNFPVNARMTLITLYPLGNW
jgi:glyoxylase-like metal-dependent hydrolase (beta-lactamase superfamily II)